LKQRAGPKPRCKTQQPVTQQQLHQQQQQQQKSLQQLQQQQPLHMPTPTPQQQQQQQQQQQFKLPPISTLLRETQHSPGIIEPPIVDPLFEEFSRKRYAAAPTDHYGSEAAAVAAVAAAAAAAAARPCKRAHSSAFVTVPYKHRSAFDVLVNDDISSSYNTANNTYSSYTNNSSSSCNNISSSSDSSGSNNIMSSYYVTNSSSSYDSISSSSYDNISNSGSFDNTSSSSYNSSSGSYNTGNRASRSAAAPTRLDARSSASASLDSDAAQQQSSNHSTIVLHAQGHANEMTRQHHDMGSEADVIAHSAQLMCSMRRRSSTGSSEGFSSREVSNSSEGDSPQYGGFNMLPGFELSSLGR
jgi:hypothetical protein